MRDCCRLRTNMAIAASMALSMVAACGGGSSNVVSAPPGSDGGDVAGAPLDVLPADSESDGAPPDRLMFDGGGDRGLDSVEAAPEAPRCNTLENSGQFVGVVEYTSLVPGNSGGTIADGTYGLTAVAEWLNPSVLDYGFRWTLKVTGSQIESFLEKQNFLNPAATSERLNATITYAPTSLVWNRTCGTGADAIGFRHQADPTRLMLVDGNTFFYFTIL